MLTLPLSHLHSVGVQLPMARPVPFDAQVAAAAVLLGIGNGMLHWQAVDRVWRDFQFEEHTRVMAGTYVSPIQYRILTYALAEGLVRLGLPIHSAHEIWRVIFTALSLFVLYKFLRGWFSPMLSLLGMFILAAIIPLTYVYYMMGVTDPLNMLVFFLAFWAMRERRDVWLIPLVAIGMLNRESPILIPLFYVAVRWGEPFRQWLPIFLGTSVAAVGIYVLLRLVYRPVCCDYGVVEALLVNLADWRAYLGAIVVFNIGLWGTWIGWRRRPEFLRRLSLMVPVFILPYLLQGTVRESRYYLPLLAIVIPMLLHYLIELLGEKPVATTASGGERTLDAAMR
jgi:hypothetical protein